MLIEPILFNDSMDFWAINPYRLDGICPDSMVFLAINPKRFESINRQLRVLVSISFIYGHLHLRMEEVQSNLVIRELVIGETWL